jgi:thiol-disulfide isomerase/thioredoxin
MRCLSQLKVISSNFLRKICCAAESEWANADVLTLYRFIEFFSPWCGHCKAFKPTWEQLVASRDDPPRLSLAQVDCTVDGGMSSNHIFRYSLRYRFREPPGIILPAPPVNRAHHPSHRL